MEKRKKFNSKIVKCSNPKCITNHETYLEPSFKEVTGEKEVYLCEYCSAENKIN